MNHWKVPSLVNDFLAMEVKNKLGKEQSSLISTIFFYWLFGEWKIDSFWNLILPRCRVKSEWKESVFYGFFLVIYVEYSLVFFYEPWFSFNGKLKFIFFFLFDYSNRSFENAHISSNQKKGVSIQNIYKFVIKVKVN